MLTEEEKKRILNLFSILKEEYGCDVDDILSDIKEQYLYN